MPEPAPDPRLQRILELLREVARDPAGDSLAPAARGRSGRARWSGADTWLTSATDLLLPWSPSATAAWDGRAISGRPAGSATAARQVWDEYLQGAAARSAAETPDRQHEPPFPPLGDLGLAQHRVSPADVADDEDLPDEVAGAATDCLFEFVRALGRRDVDAAMSCVAPDYHTIEEDREIDGATLRLEIESFLDQHGNGDLAIRIGQVPEPVYHPLGVLIHTVFTVDYSPSDGGDRRSLVEERIALLCQQPDGGWSIAGLAPLGDGKVDANAERPGSAAGEAAWASSSR